MLELPNIPREPYWRVLLSQTLFHHVFTVPAEPLPHLAATKQAIDNRSASFAPLYETFERFVQTYEHLVLNFLWRMVGDEQAAFDLTQETFLRAWQKFATIKEYDLPKAWLLRVATNLAINHKQRFAATEISTTALFESAFAPATGDHGNAIAESEQVRQILLALSPKRRAVLVLREVYGCSREEIMRVLHMTPDAVKAALFRAREQFRELYLQSERRES